MTTGIRTDSIRKLQTIYIETFPEKLAALEQYLAENDWIKIERFGHQLKGSGKAYGFSEISDLGAKIEECADIHDGSVARALQTEIRTAMTEISRQLQEEHDGQ
jgi:HPt (histidine-containing phosphotransfer) domain-containing protein